MKIVLALLTTLFLCGCSDGLPSDSSLVKSFGSRRESLEKLVAMLKNDRGIQQIDDKLISPTPSPIGAERLSTYRDLLSDVGCSRGVERDGGGFYFRAGGVAYARKGATKGYYYAPGKPSPVRTKLDGFEATPDDPQAFRYIEGSWYLFTFTNFP